MQNPSATVATTKVQPGEPDEPEEGECLFHSQMWVKGTPLHFIVDSGSQKNLISVEVIKRLALRQHHTHSRTPSDGSTKGVILRQPTVSPTLRHQALQR
jgi:hypothetical protein